MAGGVNNTDTTTTRRRRSMDEMVMKGCPQSIAKSNVAPRCQTSLLGVGLLLELVENVERLVNLGVEGLFRADERQKLVVVHLEQHTGNLTSEVRVLTGVLNQHSCEVCDNMATYGRICM